MKALTCTDIWAIPPVYVSADHRQQAHPVRQFVRQSVLIFVSIGIVTALR